MDVPPVGIVSVDGNGIENLYVLPRKQRREYQDDWESYELSEEFTRMVPYAERHSFLRSLANQTTDIVDEGEMEVL